MRDPRGPLTDRERGALRRGGADLEAGRWGSPWNPREPLRGTILELSEIVRDSLAPEDLPALLRASEEGVEDLLRRKVIYSFQAAGMVLIPVFQFSSKTGLVPGADTIWPHLAPLHPVEARGWYTSPVSDLRLDEGGRDLSPEEWLRVGGAVDPVAWLANQFDNPE